MHSLAPTGVVHAQRHEPAADSTVPLRTAAGAPQPASAPATPRSGNSTLAYTLSTRKPGSADDDAMAADSVPAELVGTATTMADLESNLIDKIARKLPLTDVLALSRASRALRLASTSERDALKLINESQTLAGLPRAARGARLADLIDHSAGMPAERRATILVHLAGSLFHLAPGHRDDAAEKIIKQAATLPDTQNEQVRACLHEQIEHPPEELQRMDRLHAKAATARDLIPQGAAWMLSAFAHDLRHLGPAYRFDAFGAILGQVPHLPKDFKMMVVLPCANAVSALPSARHATGLMHILTQASALTSQDCGQVLRVSLRTLEHLPDRLKTPAFNTILEHTATLHSQDRALTLSEFASSVHRLPEAAQSTSFKAIVSQVAALEPAQQGTVLSTCINALIAAPQGNRLDLLQSILMAVRKLGQEDKAALLAHCAELVHLLPEAHRQEAINACAIE